MRRKHSKGLTLVELMIAGVILTVVALSLIGVLGNLAKAVTSSREVTLSTHLAEEQLESIKSLSFYAIMVTSVTPPVLDSNFSPPIPYDPGYYPPESIKIGGTTFTRKTFIEKASTPSGYVEDVGYPHPDTGLKRITVTVSWQNKHKEWRKVQLTSLSSNPDREPLDRRIYGNITDSVTGGTIQGVQVLNKRNPGQGGTADENGDYSFQTTDDNIRVIASRYGYAQYYSSSFSVDYGDNLFNFQMVPLSSRTVTGFAMRYASAVISAVSLQWDGGVDSDKYYVELYNGSSKTISALDIQLQYVDAGDLINNITITTVTATIPASSYYLILGSPGQAATTAPNGFAADATFDYAMNAAAQGGIRLVDSVGTLLDQVAWGDASNSPPSNGAEGTGKILTGGSPGIGVGNALVRKAMATSTVAGITPGGEHWNGGNAYDSQDNEYDFYLVSATQTARNSTRWARPMGGIALSGAFISGEDPVSTTYIATSTGYYKITVQTGTWNLTAGSSTKMGVQPITVSGSGPFEQNIWAVLPATVGYISGTLIKYGGDPLNNIIVQADPGEVQDVTSNGGLFFLTVEADESYYLTANPNFQDPEWNTAVSSDAIYVGAGEISSGHQLSCWANSYVSGRVTTNGTDGVPNIPVQALGQWSNGNSALTDAAGYYTIAGLRIAPNPYDIFPVLQSDQEATPATYNMNVVRGVNSTGYDFVITNARVNISGSVLYNSASIASGVNVIASTSSISASTPPDITFALRASGQRYYQAVSDGQGYYTLSVIGGNTYNLVAWYTDKDGTTSKTNSVTLPSNTGQTGVNFSWP